MAQIRQHKNATTTPALRRWIQENRHLPTAQIMREKGLSRNTVVRWKNRDNTDDASSKPHSQTSQFADWQEALIVEIRATFLLPMEIMPDKSATSAAAFLQALIKAFPGTIEKILTDNGKEFTDRYSRSGERDPTGKHPFDRVCRAHAIEHRLIKPQHPQTNGMVERFNGRIAQILKTTRFQSSQELAETLKNYLHSYNHLLPQKAIGYKPPVQALAQQLNHPNLKGMDS